MKQRLGILEQIHVLLFGTIIVVCDSLSTISWVSSNVGHTIGKEGKYLCSSLQVKFFHSCKEGNNVACHRQSRN